MTWLKKRLKELGLEKKKINVLVGNYQKAAQKYNGYKSKSSKSRGNVRKRKTEDWYRYICSRNITPILNNQKCGKNKAVLEVLEAVYIYSTC